MERFAAHFCEWVEGGVIPISPVYIYHDRLTRYLAILLETFLSLRPIGQICQAPFVMRLPAFPNRRREPNLLLPDALPDPIQTVEAVKAMLNEP